MLGALSRRTTALTALCDQEENGTSVTTICGLEMLSLLLIPVQ